MSNSKATKQFFEKEENFKKNSQLNKDILISYKEEKIKKRKSEDFYEAMKYGYKEMGEINLQYAEEGIELALNDELEYEMWLCGV